MFHFLSAVVASSLLYSTQAYVSTKFAASRQPRVKPVAENFGLDIAEDQFENSVREIAGEANYKNFVASYNPEALLLGGPSYDVVTRLRELKLLTLTAESGLLQALEARGLTLSQIEKLLPLVDDLNLLPVLASNKDLVRNTLLPLLVEPAPLLLPLVVNVLKTNPSQFQLFGSVFLGLGLFEDIAASNVILGSVLILLGLPFFALGAVLSGSIPLPEPSSSSASSPVSTASSFTLPSVASVPVADGSKLSFNRPVAQKKKVAAPAPEAPVAAAPSRVAIVAAPAVKTVAKPVVKAAAPVTVVVPANAPRRVRKTVRIN